MCIANSGQIISDVVNWLVVVTIEALTALIGSAASMA